MNWDLSGRRRSSEGYTLAAQFMSLQPAGQCLQDLGALLLSRRDIVGYRVVIPGDAARGGGDDLILILVLATMPVPPDYERIRIHDIFKKYGGKTTDTPQVIRDRLFREWLTVIREQEEQAPQQPPNMLLMSTQQEGILVATTSHAKCRDCGGTRHKIARLNLCQGCWEKVKPAVRREWRDIKERRQLRQAVDEHITEQRRQREAQDQMVLLRQARNNVRQNGIHMPELTDQEAAKLEIARIRAEGVPPMGTPGRAEYMRLFTIAQGGYKRDADDLDRMIGRLYAETAIQVKDILSAVGVDGNRLRRVQNKLQMPNRDDMAEWRTGPALAQGEKLIVINGVPMIQLAGSLTTRPVFSDTPTVESEPEPVEDEQAADEQPEQEPEKQREPEPEPTPVAHEPVAPTDNGTEQAPRRRRRVWTDDVKAEIAGWYADASIPIAEIMQAYGLPSSTLGDIRQQFNLPPRRSHELPHRNQFTGPRLAGRFEMIDGKHQWIPGEPGQLNLGQAAGAELLEREALVTPQPTTPTQWIEQATRTFEEDQQQALATIAVPRAQKAWMFTYVPAPQRRMISAATFEEALAELHAVAGRDIDIEQAQRV